MVDPEVDYLSKLGRLLTNRVRGLLFQFSFVLNIQSYLYATFNSLGTYFQRQQIYQWLKLFS